jgi:hypothetical protein
MATNTSAELGVVLYNLENRGLDEFLPEAQRGDQLWLRVPDPSAADVRRWEPYVARTRSRAWPLAVPVVIAATIVGGVVSWARMGPGASVVPAVPRVAPAGAAAAADAVAPPVADAVALPVPQPAAETAPPVTRAETVLAPAAAPVPADTAFVRTLAAVSQSYRTLDAAALTGVWPGADTASLAERFSELKYQSLTFDRCQVRPSGVAGALASCEVSIAAAPKSGEPLLQRRRESWTLVMDRSADRWTITGVSVQ